MKEIYEIDLNNIDFIEKTHDLYKARTFTSYAMDKNNTENSEVTILVTGYNRLEKTKRCVESILKHTKDVDYNLILVDNGSTDGTFEYFKSVDYHKTKIYKFNKNFQHKIIYYYIDIKFISQYYVSIADDLVLTENWLSNLLKVIKSDNRIGMVNPMSSNVSNYQAFDMHFNDFDDMQNQAMKFNISDSVKWQERLRLVTLGTLYRKECIYAIGWPTYDVGFTHDFSDDDLTFRIRRAGYKAILAGDTWIHHDHDVFNLEDKDPVEFQLSLDIGRKNFRDKYFGIDAWNDVNNYVFPFICNYIEMPSDFENVKILGIDTKCGTPILDIKNLIREYGIFNPELSAFTRDSKYHIDLKTICDGNVVCDRPEFIYNSFKSNSFDYIIIDECINCYHEPEKVVRDAYALLKSGGQMFIKLRNTFNVFTLLELMGYNLGYSESACHYRVDNFCNTLKKMGINVQLICNEVFEVDSNISDYVSNIINQYKSDDESEEVIYNKMIINNFWLKIKK